MTTAPRPDPRSDECLATQAGRGDALAFESLYHRYRDWVVSLAYRFTGNEEDALDVLQETFSYVHSRLPTLVLRSKMTTFLYPVVKHIAARAREKRGRFASDESALEQVVSPAIRERPDTEALALAVGSLTDEQREVVILRFVDDLSLEEIAQALDVPLGTVKSRLHHALRKLREGPRTRRYLEP